jgi:Inorganic Pyrophosphatase
MNLDQTLNVLANQKEYRDICGLRIAVEYRAGDIRKGEDKQGRPWSVRLPFPYGRIQGTKGVDGMAVDAILGPLKNPKKVWVISMPRHRGNEDKVMLGFASESESVKAFLRMYSHKKKFIGKVKEMNIDKLKKRLVTRRGTWLSASGWMTSPWSNYQYHGFDPVPPRNTVPVSNPGYDEDDPVEALIRKDPKNIRFYTELTRRLGAKTIAESHVAENWPYGGVEGLP